jgi:hypothetical protein
MFQKGTKRPSLKRAKFQIAENVVARCCHYKNAAAAAKGSKLYSKSADDMAARIVGIKTGAMNPNLFQAVDVRLGTWEQGAIELKDRNLEWSWPSWPKEWSAENFATLVSQAAQVNPKGFRQPSSKAKNWRSTSLVEKSMWWAGQMEHPTFERSKRGLLKQRLDAEMKEAISKGVTVLQLRDLEVRKETEE